MAINPMFGSTVQGGMITTARHPTVTPPCAPIPITFAIYTEHGDPNGIAYGPHMFSGHLTYAQVREAMWDAEEAAIKVEQEDGSGGKALFVTPSKADWLAMVADSFAITVVHDYLGRTDGDPAPEVARFTDPKDPRFGDPL